MRRSVIILVATLALLGFTSCSSGGDGASSATIEPNPMDAKAEVRDAHADFGWDRTDSDQAVLATLLEAAGRVTASPVGCVDPSETPIDVVKTYFDVSHLPIPAATVQCVTNDEEDLTFEGFTDEAGKLTFLEAKQDLLCARGKQAGTDPSSGVSGWSGLPYVDGGTWIIEPNGNDTRDTIAQALGLTAGNMCPDIATDPAPVPQF